MKPGLDHFVERSPRQFVINAAPVLCFLYFVFALAHANAQMALPGPGLINTIAGNGNAGYGGDGGSAVNAELQYPGGIAVDSNGNVYIADSYNNRIRKVTASTGIIATVAGNGTAGYSGDGGAATGAELNYPVAVAVDGFGNIYIADESNERTRKVTVSTGIISTVAGNGTLAYSGDGGAATKAALDEPLSVAVDSSGNIYEADFGNRIRKIAVSTGVITTVAGNGTAGYSGDGGAATNAELHYPSGVAVDSSGNIYIADTSNERVRKVTASTGTITTVAGNGTLGYSGDGGAATGAELGYPWGIALDSSGNIYIGDSNNNRVRKITVSSGIISSVAGDGVKGYAGDGGNATNGALNGPEGVAVDGSGNPYIGDSLNSRIRAVGGAFVPSAPASPTFSPAAGTYQTAQAVTISDATNGTAIYYTTNGTTPTTSSAQYTGPVSVSSTETINAIAVANGLSSSVSTATYTINLTSPVSTAVITVQGSEQADDASGITVSFNGYTETVPYGQFSTAAAIASAFGAKFSNDYLHAGLCAHASGAVITFQLKGAAFGILDVGGSTMSFQLSSSGFASQQSSSVPDAGTVTLTVSGVVAAQANYGNGSTAITVAAGLRAGITSGSPVNITGTGDSLYLQAIQSGAATNYSYTLQTTSWDSTDFPSPSFAYPPVSGNLSGGADASPGQGPQTIYSYSIPSYVAGSQPTGYDAVGDIVGYSDSVMGSWNMSGGYDPLYRLTAASATSGPYGGLQINWGYDAFGNRTSESYSGTTNAPVPGNSTASYNTSNRIYATSLGSVGYDAAGDVTSDNQNQYLYDGEGRVCAVHSLVTGAMTGYVYGADGARVSEGTITAWGSCDPSQNGYQAVKDSIQGPTGGQLTETSVSGGNVTWAHTNVWANGQLIASYDPNGLHFFLDDWTGSRRVQTDYQGTVEQTCTNLPYGESQSCGPAPSSYVFAGLQRDSMANMDDAVYRQYGSAFGRWTTPDPYGGSADISNPQSLNRYAYAGNSPFVAADPSGLDDGCGVDAGGIIDCVLSYGGPDLGWDSGSLDIPLLGEISPFFDIADTFYSLGKDFGWWGGGPSFHGNVAASQSGKNVPGTSSANVPGPPVSGDVAIDNPWGQAAFGPQSAGTWTAANTTVEWGAGLTTAAYSGAFLLPYLPSAASYATNAAGLLGPATNRVFWSAIGAEKAAELAAERGGSTLEMSPLGGFANWAQSLPFVPQNSITGAVWRALSSGFASGAQGPVIYLRGAYLGRMWLTTELPILEQNGNPITTVPVP